LLIAIELTAERSADVVSEALKRGLVVNNVTPSAVRLAPPLVVSEQQIARAIEILASVIGALQP
jgi:acetylornithine/succinyldiaminopimelate/putrescine aminotransferase